MSDESDTLKYINYCEVPSHFLSIVSFVALQGIEFNGVGGRGSILGHILNMCSMIESVRPV